MNILIAFMFLGCRHDKSSSGDVVIDFIIDSSNGKIDDKWTSEEQKSKYIRLANIDPYECFTTLSRAFSKLIVDEHAKDLLTTDEQTHLETIKKSSPDEQNRATRFIAHKLCTHLLVLKHER